MYPRDLKNLRTRDMFMCSSLVRLVQYVPTRLEELAQTFMCSSLVRLVQYVLLLNPRALKNLRTRDMFMCSSLVRLVQYVPTRLEELAHTRHVYV
jgi:hypothetical protein